MILHFVQTFFREGPGGAFVDERRCIEHPRISQLQQCAKKGRPTLTSFMVENVANVFHSIEGALDALRANPKPGDIVAVPPKDIGHEPDCDRAEG